MTAHDASLIGHSERRRRHPDRRAGHPLEVRIRCLADHNVPIAGWDFVAIGAEAAFDELTNDPTAEPVSGVGDRAIWLGGDGRLIVLVGDASVSVSVFDAQVSSDTWRATTIEIAMVLVSRMG